MPRRPLYWLLTMQSLEQFNPLAPRPAGACMVLLARAGEAQE